MNKIRKRKNRKYRKTHKPYPIFICNSCFWQYMCSDSCTKYIRCKYYEYNESKYMGYEKKKILRGKQWLKQ